jgi:hypothetical protein
LYTTGNEKKTEIKTYNDGKERKKKKKKKEKEKKKNRRAAYKNK